MHTEPCASAPRRVRPPFSTEFIDCTCSATDKDDCSCVRAAVDSLSATMDVLGRDGRPACQHEQCHVAR